MNQRSKVSKGHGVKLSTMRADLSGHTFCGPLAQTLEEYDRRRAVHGPEGAETASEAGGSANMFRLRGGMRRMTRQSILRITAKHWDDQPYIKSHLTYFTDLVGLFYFNAGPMGEAVIAAILKNAWRKGKSA
jgi:hypothetical protein